jgi:HPt (histidine-containing phosphotransfer) domain-containing protein
VILRDDGVAHCSLFPCMVSFIHMKRTQIEIPGIDPETVLDSYDDDMEIYRVILRAFVDKIPALLDKIRKVSSRTLSDYIIKIHALKGSGGNIGAREMMAAAAGLEAMAKNGDLDGVLAGNDVFLEKTRVLIDDIKKWLEQSDAPA